ncbi:YgjP-like metallopeptidase domain-containing protein [uncultured Prevotella sp.]|uniref:M48 family metallopeptidase n=1 Tax=uncultured Prevotella sp. TaxID=159272 RepID=UPI0025D61E86|nr:YgjP-like metallopeptidase domain-containing protein [uncultured Prevotella sp.]
MAIQVTYRRTRRLSMRIVKNGDVHVSAPFGIPKSEVERFIEEHREWIAEARKKTCESQKQRADFYHQLPLKTKEQAEDALQRLKALIEPMVEHHSKVIGVKPSVVYYKAMISRWGVCNVKDKSICFSAYLLLLPEWCVEHVVVHELCHLLEPSHNARFHALMDKFFPRWKEARRETRRLLKSPAA